MAGTTDNFAFTFLVPGDSLADNNYAFINQDVKFLDRILQRDANHDHSGVGASIADPGVAPSLVLDSAAGDIPAGTTVRYKFTYVDVNGLETAGSPEATVTTAAAVVTPGGPGLTSLDTGGTLLGGTYFYQLSAYTVTNNQETRGGTKNSITVAFATATNVITLTLPSLPTGADGFNVYRRAPGETNYNYIASIDMTVATPPTTYTDDGTASPNCSRQPVQSNQTNATNQVTVSLPGATPTTPAGVTWKVYRTFTLGDYGSSLLHWVVEETFEGSGVIDPTFLDTGLGTMLGSPPTNTQVLGQPGKIDMTDAAEIEGTPPPGLLTVPYEVTFTVDGPLWVHEGTKVWLCPYDFVEIQEVTCTLGRGFAPASSDVIVDVNFYECLSPTPSWTTIYTTQGNRPTVPVGEQCGTPTTPDIVDLTKGDLLSIDVDQIGGGATPTDENLAVTILMLVKYGSETTSTILP